MNLLLYLIVILVVSPAEPNEVNLCLPDIFLDTTRVETGLRMPRLLITTPMNAYVLLPAFDDYEDFFVSYPFLRLQNDTLYFRGSNNILLLKDGVPIRSLKDVCFPAVEKIEVISENIAIYGDYDGVANVITKKFYGDMAYSNFKLLKNPDKVQFEFGRTLGIPNFDIYLAGDLVEDTSHISCNLGYKTKALELRGYYEHYDKEFILCGALFSKFKFSVKEDFYSVSQEFNLGNHRFLAGTEESSAFIQDYWEIKPLLYVVPSVRQGEEFYPKVSVGYIPMLNTTIFGSISEEEVNIGIRYYESAINLFRKEQDNGAELRIVSPWIYNFKLGGAIGAKWQPGVEFTDEKTIFVEYKQKLEDRELSWYIIGDMRNEFVRIELQLLDAKLFYRMSRREPAYGLLWEFWD